jgi:hypothetical protein
MNPNPYKQRLLAKEKELSARVERAMVNVREPPDRSPHDAGDEGSTDELKEEQLEEAEPGWLMASRSRKHGSRQCHGLPTA